jgi:hypothetical protein
MRHESYGRRTTDVTVCVASLNSSTGLSLVILHPFSEIIMRFVFEAKKMHAIIVVSRNTVKSGRLMPTFLRSKLPPS